MLYHRGNSLDYDTWESLGNAGWGWKHVKTYFEKSLRPGGLILGCFENFDSFMDVIEKAAQELGQNHWDQFDENHYIGYARAKVFASNGRRMSTGKVFLAAVKDRPNLHVVKHAIAKRIHFSKNGKTADSIEFVYKDKITYKLKARKEIILSAGTIGSAKLLMLSGIGPQNHLKSLQIPVVKNLSVGLNYQDHVRVPLYFRYRDNDLNSVESLDNLEKYLLHNKGPLTSRNMIFLQGFINSDPESHSSYPDLQFSHYTRKETSFRNDLESNTISETLDNVPKTRGIYQVDTILLRPKSKGWMLLRSGDYSADPQIFPNYFEDRKDLETVIRGLRYQLRFRNTKAFKRAAASIMEFDIPECRGLEYKSDQHLTCYIRYLSANGYHSVGTAKMGPSSDPDAVVDNTLKVHGVSGLRIGDASIMPNIVSGNTNAATIMIAERLADFVKDDYS
ncbi:hypothetical protein ACFFRR_000201 [Megaselia abdita]